MHRLVIDHDGSRDIITRKHQRDFHHFLFLSLVRENTSYYLGREAGNFTWQLCSLCWKDYSSLLLFIYFSSLLSRRKRKFGILSLPKLISRVVPSLSNPSLSLFLSFDRDYTRERQDVLFSLLFEKNWRMEREDFSMIRSFRSIRSF